MNQNEWLRVLQPCSLLLRHGAVTTATREGKIEVTTINLMPALEDLPADPDRVVVDMVLVMVAVLKSRAEEAYPEICRLLDKAPPELFEGGPSYITLGAILGDQGLAFKAMAVMGVLGMTEVITPMTFGVTGETARQAAGQGYVMLSPMKAPWSQRTKEEADARAQPG